MVRARRQRPLAGVGIGLRREHEHELPVLARELDFLEIIPENYVGRGGRGPAVLRACAERWPVAVHGVSMSIGGPDGFEPAWIDAIDELLDRVDAPFYSDHLCYATIGGITSFDLLPLPFSAAAVEHAIARIRALRDRLGREVVVENITYYATMPGSEMDEGAFVRAVVEGADCGLLLDLNNVYVNARNHGRDPLEVLWALPIERARQIHLAGFWPEDGRLIDDHGAPVDDAVWSLYREAIARLGPVPTLIEWDNRIPPLARVLDEADRARAIQHELRHPEARTA